MKSNQELFYISRTFSKNLRLPIFFLKTDHRILHIDIAKALFRERKKYIRPFLLGTIQIGFSRPFLLSFNILHSLLLLKLVPTV